MALNRLKFVLSVLLMAMLLPIQLMAKDAPTDEQLNQYVTLPEAYEQEQYERYREELAKRGDVKENPGYVPGYRTTPGLGLSPAAPVMTPVAVGGAAPAFGSRTRSKSPRFEFHGYLQPTLRMGIGKGGANNATTLHADPVVAGGSYGWFDHSNTVPTPWAQINFSYGNEVVKATAMIGAWSATEGDEAAGNYMANAQQLFTDVFLTYTPDISPVQIRINAGVFPDRYGFMAKYHQGAYGTSLVGDIYGVGATGSLQLPLVGKYIGDIDVTFEGGFKGDMAKVPYKMPLDGSTEHAPYEQGATFAGHGHMAVNLGKYFTPAAHVIYSFSADDSKDSKENPGSSKDGSLLITAGDLRVDMKRFGYLYTGFSRIKGEHTRALTNLVQILNTGSGKDLAKYYWGEDGDGTGTMTLLGMQYSLSLGTLLRHPMRYSGVGPDLVVNLFGIFGKTTSEAASMDDRKMMKYGTELYYSFAKHLAGAFRFDHVMPDFSDQKRSFEVFSPKLILRSDWVHRESIVFQYSYYNTGDNVIVQGDNRLVNTVSGNPDHHMVAVYGTIWW